METLEHLPLVLTVSDGRYIIEQQIGGTVVTIKIGADQATQVGRFLLKEREPDQGDLFADEPGLDQGFDQFWSSYPRRDGRARALDLWKRQRLGNKLQVVLAHLTAIKQTPQWTDQGGKFVPHAGTYLSQRRYLDEVEVEDFSSFR